MNLKTELTATEDREFYSETRTRKQPVYSGIFTVKGNLYIAISQSNCTLVNPEVLEEMKSAGDTQVYEVISHCADKDVATPMELLKKLYELDERNENARVYCEQILVSRLKFPNKE